MKKKSVNSAVVPVYRDAGFELYDARTTADAFRNESDPEHEPELYIYSRYRNPTVVSAESEIQKIEGCKWALLAQSGMAAIDVAVSIFQNGDKTGPWLFFSEIYGGTISFVDSVLRNRRGIDIHYFTPVNGKYDIDELDRLLSRLKPSFVYAETISNPLLVVADISAIIRVSKKHGARVIVDNTFATPYLYKPLDHGADLVIHSATKYFAGHGDLTAGIICGNDRDLMKAAIEYRKYVGHMISPDDAGRLRSYLKTFNLRVEKQFSNASRLAEFLARIPEIRRVFYPGLADHPTHDIASQLLSQGFGAMITFDFDGRNYEEKKDRRDRFIKLIAEKVRLIPTLGDPATILMPVEAVWGAKYPEPGMIRLSVGFEDYEQLEASVAAALGRKSR